MDGGETAEGENVFHRSAIDWALRTSNGWMDDKEPETKDEWKHRKARRP